VEKSARDQLILAEYAPASCVLDTEGHCITCSDEALPASVLRIEQETGVALVTIGIEQSEVDITLVEAVEPGDWLLVHGGVAIARLENPPAHEVDDE
jgi:hydrogenase assembly chaperone HypC/HupF